MSAAKSLQSLYFLTACYETVRLYASNRQKSNRFQKIAVDIF